MSDKQHAAELLDRLGPNQLAAVVHLLEAIVEPDVPVLGDVPVDDEPETEQERQAVAEAHDWLQRNGGKGVPHAEAMRQLGLD